MNAPLLFVGGALFLYGVFAMYSKHELDAMLGQNTTVAVWVTYIVFATAGAWCVLQALTVI